MPKLKLPEGEGAVKPGGRDPQILGDRGVELQGLSIYGMLEGEVLGVQPEPTAGGRATVERVSVHRMSDGREVDPDLVRPPRLEVHAEHRVSRSLGQYLEVRHGRLPYPCGHQRGVIGVTADRRVDRTRP